MKTRLKNNVNSVGGVLTGIRKASDIITSTMGGSGKNVLFFEGKEFQFTKDGVSVADKIEFANIEEDAGAKLLITAANKTVKQCGDGTTLTSLLVKEFTDKLFTLCENGSVNNILDKWQEDIDLIIAELESRTVKVKSLDDIYKIALTSCKNDKLALLIYEIYRKVGLKAAISVQLSPDNSHTVYEVTKGLNFDGGSMHPGFANQLNGTYQAEKPIIIIDEEVMSRFEDYSQGLSELHERKVPIVIIAKDFSDSFLRGVLTNKSAKGLDICLLKIPGWGSGQQENIKDIKAFLNSDSTVNKITVTGTDFTLYNSPSVKKIKTRIKQLEAQIEGFTEAFDVIDFQKRIDTLNQTSAIIYVGGRTRSNAEEEFDRIEDAIGACKTACSSGYVKGAGAELVSIGNKLKGKISTELENILYAPTNKIFSNANIDMPVHEESYNVKTRQLDNSLLDPTNVLIVALLNSFALATLLINTSYILHD